MERLIQRGNVPSSSGHSVQASHSHNPSLNIMKTQDDFPISGLPSEVQHLMINHLDAASMFSMLLTCHQYKNIISADCQHIWKKHHDARWKYSKLRRKPLRDFTDEIIEWSRENGWALHRKSLAPQIDQVEGAGDWFAEYLYRSKVDTTVLPDLTELSLGNLSSDRIWHKLIQHGEDILDRVLAIMTGKEDDKDLISVAWQENDVQFKYTLVGMRMAAMRENEDSVLRPCHKFYWGIGRYFAYQEWRFLHESGVETFIEDGAITISKFYRRSDHDDVHVLLEQLAHWLKIRLRERHGEPDQSNSTPYPIREILMQMSYLFGNEAPHDEDIIKDRTITGNNHDYYNPENSLIDQVINKGKGIPITLAVIYIAIVRKAFGIELDVIGLPGHIVVGVPQSISNERIFADPFHNGRLLTFEDCRDLVSRYNITFRDEFVNPMDHKAVWQRMIRNL